MKKVLVIFIVLFICTVSLSAQELTIIQQSEGGWRISIILNKEVTSSGTNYFFTFSYVGEDFRSPRSITLKIDGNEHFLIFSNITQDWTGYATEICRTKNLDNSIINSIRNTNRIEGSVHLVRWDENFTFSISNDMLVRMKQNLR